MVSVGSSERFDFDSLVRFIRWGRGITEGACGWELGLNICEEGNYQGFEF